MYYNARWYDPALGRFAQADTVVPISTQGVQAWDRYAYVNNNPLRYTDPSGHFIDPVSLMVYGMIAGALIGGTVNAIHQYQATGNIDAGEVAYAALGTAVAVGAVVMAGTVIAAVAGTVAAATTTTTAVAGAACADGDCTNEGITIASLGGDVVQSLNNVNPTGSTGNCVNCAVATDMALSGSPTSALPMNGSTIPQSINALSQNYNPASVQQAFSSTTRISNITNELTSAGPGARGIVFGNGNIFVHLTLEFVPRN